MDGQFSKSLRTFDSFFDRVFMFFYHESQRREINDVHLNKCVGESPILILSLLRSSIPFTLEETSFDVVGVKHLNSRICLVGRTNTIFC
jgi:hypothetical protein